ncbi:hypothetical protein Stsp01_65470 [Streptomyces sp. NBRC 13847]|nr:hypothetical protein Stsp01_65470 [Streptomyces sp. NBRC 13847]
MWEALYGPLGREGHPPLAIVFTKQVGPTAMNNRMPRVRLKGASAGPASAGLVRGRHGQCHHIRHRADPGLKARRRARRPVRHRAGDRLIVTQALLSGRTVSLSTSGTAWPSSVPQSARARKYRATIPA